MISAILLCAVFSAAQASYRIEPAPHGDLYVPEAADRLTPKVLAIHGGGWRTQDRASFRGVAEALATRGAIVYNIDYRVPAQAPWPACGDDCLAAAEWLSGWRTNDFTETVFILGGTSGGHLSLMTGLRFDRRKVAGVISISGPADSGHDRGTPPDRFEQLLLKGLGDAEAARAFPTAYVSADLPDILLTHCYSDELVPVLSAKNFESKLRDVGAFVETYYYDFGRENEGHAIWVKGSNPPRLYPDIEDRVWRFITERFGRDALKVVGTVKAKSSREVSDISTVSVGFEGLDRHLFDPEPCYDKLAETGVKRARIQVGWSLCEPSKGVYDFSELDAVVSNLTVRGIEPWMMVGFGNTNWMGKCYTPAAVGCMPLYYGPECQAAWERFVAKLAARYAKKIRYWEIWNEPDIDSFWQPRQPSAADYAKLVKLTGGIIRRAVPGAKIGGVCSTVLNDWLREAVPLAAEGVDFWSIHAYGVVPERARGAQRDPNGREWDFVGQVVSVRDLFVKAGRPNVEIWQAEAGFPSWFKANHWLLGQNREGLGCEEWQAKWLLRRFLSDRRAGCASSSFYAAADICRSYSMATTTQAHPAEHGLLDSRRGYVRKASHRAMSVYNATLAEATFVSSRKVGEVIVDEYVRDGRRLVAYYRADNLMENRPASTWDAGEAVLTPGGRLTDLLTGRIYARPKRLPLRDYPMLWSEAGGPVFSWRLELADGSVVVPTNAAAKGYAVTAEFKRAADGAYDYGPFTWKTSDTQEVRTVAWPIVTVPRTDDAAILYSEVWGSPGNLRRPDWEKAAVGKNLNVVRDAPAFRFGALLNGAEPSWYLDSRETDLAQVRFFFRKGAASGTAEIEAQHPLPATIVGGRLVPFCGGWFEAAAIYRAWARELPRTKAARARDRSRLRDISMWFWNRGLVKDALPPVERFRRDTGVGVALDWYWWHAIPYDSGYPNFWPPREGVADFRAAIARLKVQGVYTQVYMNGMTWDMDDPSWREGGAEDAILPLKAVAFNVYDHHRLANLCGYAPHFQKRMSENVRQLAESGLDGIYLDMISVGSREALCRNPSHPHRPGDSVAQAEGWRRYLTDLKRAHPQLHLSSEDASEAYLDTFDSYICCMPSYERIGFGAAPKAECVPVFMAVYHDAITMFGSYAMIDGIPPWDPKWPDKDRWQKEEPWERLFPDQFAVELSRGVAWGLQPTVHNFRLSGATDARYAADYRFMVDTARFHAAHRDFLFDGEMCAPGVLNCATQTVEFLKRGIYAKEGDYRTVRAPLPTIFHSVWRAPDGRVAAVLVNWTRREVPYRLDSPEGTDEGTLPARTYRSVELKR